MTDIDEELPVIHIVDVLKLTLCTGQRPEVVNIKNGEECVLCPDCRTIAYNGKRYNDLRIRH